jgi:very-short-patch-repair endonuclease
MDFLLLLPGRRRVVLELDGRQHYADEQGRADTARYAEMVAEDRKLRLAGYEVYRFGGAEFVDRKQATVILREFFVGLLELST